MADEIINIATLTIDKSGVNESIVDTRKQIFELQKANSELRKDITKNGDASGEQTKKFIENEKAIKDLNAVYKTQQSAINDLTLAELKNSKALTETAKSIDQANAQSKELLKIRNQLDTSTVEGAAALELINDRINKNREFVVANGSAQEKAANITGNYRQAITNLGGSFGGATQQVIGFVQNGRDVISSLTEIGTQATASVSKMIGFQNATVRAQQANEQLSNSAGAAAKSAIEAGEGSAIAGQGAEKGAGGIMTMVKAAWAFVANPIGAALLAIVGAIVLLITAFKSFQPLVDKVEQGLAALSAVFNVIKNTVVALFTGTKSLGEAFKGLGGDMSKAAKEAAALTKAQQDLEDAMKAQEVTTAKNRAEINKLNVELKNRTKTEKERLAIADEIAKKENADYQQRKKLVDEEVRQARAAIAIKAQFTEQEKKLLKETGDATKELAESRGGNYDAEYEALNKARIKAIDLENEATVNLEKVYNRRDKLQDDAAAKELARQEKAKAAAEKATQAYFKNAETQIAILKAKNAQLSQIDEERLKFISEISQKEINLLNEKKNRGLITEKEYTLGVLIARKALSEEILSIAEKQIETEITAQNKQFEYNSQLNEQQLNESIANAQFLRDVQLKRIEESTLLESEKAQAIIEINQGYVEAIDILDQNYAAAQKQREEVRIQEEQTLRDVAFQNRLLQLEEQGATELELRRAQLDIDHEQKRLALDADLAAEKKTAEEVQALKLLNDRQYAAATKKIDKEVAATKRAAVAGIAQDAIAAAQSIFGESKALAVAMALINTYQGITAVWANASTLPEPFATGQKVASTITVAASGFAAVKNILKTDKGSASAGGGTDATAKSSPSTFENAARTSSVATVNANPPQDQAQAPQPVLVLESLKEVQNNVEVKIKSS